MLNVLVLKEFHRDNGGPLVKDGGWYLAPNTARLSESAPLIRDAEKPGTAEHRRLRTTYLTIRRNEAQRAYTSAANELRSKLHECERLGCQIWFDVKAERQQVLDLKIALSLREFELRKFLSPEKTTAEAEAREAEAARDRNRDTARVALEACSDALEVER